MYWLEEESVTIRKIVGKIAVVRHSKMTLLAAELLFFWWEVRSCIAYAVSGVIRVFVPLRLSSLVWAPIALSLLSANWLNRMPEAGNYYLMQHPSHGKSCPGIFCWLWWDFEEISTVCSPGFQSSQPLLLNCKCDQKDQPTSLTPSTFLWSQFLWNIL